MSGNNDAKSDGDEIKLDATLKAGTGTDSETLKKEEEAINIDGLNTKEVKDLRDKVRNIFLLTLVQFSFIKCHKKRVFSWAT